MDSSNLNFLIAFIAGFVSFISPCVIVLVPAFLAYLAGVSLSELSNQTKTSRFNGQIVINTIIFILGFTSIFIAFGAALGFVSQFFLSTQRYLEIIGGSLIILFGIITTGLIKLKFLKGGLKLSKPGGVKYLSSFITGAAFAIGWSPCVGPILGAILVLAGTTGSIGQGVLLLTSYSIGMMLPFLVVGLFIGSSQKWLQKLVPKLKYINIAAGIILILLGVLLLTGDFPKLISYLYFLGGDFIM